MDLIGQLARLQNADPEVDPEIWYRATFNADPSYSELLDALASTPAERSRILRRYFEPTEEERQRGEKLPTAAHHAIAELVGRGHLRVIVTTNFDRLLEQALERLGIIPTVIASPDASEGALPITHTNCTIIKLHGDYLDTRIRNTPSELDAYDERVDRLLDRILDEFGLIVCGWSGEWDTALRHAIERCPTRRFTTYWCGRGQPSDLAQRLIDHRRATVIPIRDADAFFVDLSEKVSALDELTRPHPLSTAIAVETLKRYLEGDQHRIRLHDLVTRETERVHDAVFKNGPPANEPVPSGEEFGRRLAHYDSVTETLRALLANGCFWSKPDHGDLWIRSIRRLANAPELAGPRYGRWEELRLYPAMTSLFTAGIAAIAAADYGTLHSLLVRLRITRARREEAGAMVLIPRDVTNFDAMKRVPGMERMLYPASEYLFRTLRPTLAPLLPDDVEYQRAFDRFEYLLALVHADLRVQEGGNLWGPVGLYAYRQDVLEEVQAELEQEGSEWELLRAGLFGGSLERAQSIKAAWDDSIRQHSRTIF